MTIPVRRLNHVVLYVQDVARAAGFYQQVFGFEEVARMPGAAFLRAAGGTNHHDLGLFERPRSGERDSALYHLAWEVPELADLVAARDELARIGALVGASDHGTSKSLYGVDPDGNEFEVMWAVPADEWGDGRHLAPTLPLDLERELRERRAATSAGG